MKRSIIRGVLGIALVTAAGIVPASAYADEIREFNDGNGNCGLMSCGAYGCQVIERHYCPDEVSPNG